MRNLLKSLSWVLAGALASAAIGQDAPAGPEPIQIERKGGRPTIPEVERDKVICFALYTVQDGILKLSAQLYPLPDGVPRKVELFTDKGSGWEKVASADVDEEGWLATFRVEDWDHSESRPYLVTHPDGATYEGLIRKDPKDKREIVLAALSCNSNSDRSMRPDIVQNLKTLDPDSLFFAGDQSYDHAQHTAAWLLFGRQFGEIMRDRPTITIPDDHDVGHPNLWGEGGKVSHIKGAADGGYTMRPEYVRMVERAQTAHLPDPYDPRPIQQGIGVYYTSLNVGGVDFAILEDRKWKTGPAGLIPQQGPRPDHINDPNYDRTTVDVPEARLLGKRQLEFLNAWGQDWEGAEIKAVLSQTPFAGGAHIHGGHDGRLLADLDSNGWPQSGRNRALRELRRCFAIHISGDQHLSTVLQHGINAFGDSGYSFCVPSIVNYYARWWWPLEDAIDHDPMNPLPFTGKYYDGFGNKLTMHAYANPTPANYHAAGFGIVRFNKDTRKIRMECWPRHVDVMDKPAERQFTGWPVEITQMDNYGREAMAYLPTIHVNGMENPVVQIWDEYLEEVVYTLRIKGSTFRPKVYREATYTITVGEGDKKKSFTCVPSIGADVTKYLEVDF